ncbi:isochorismate synthase [Brasilonema sp. CT11]|nr:isochorismate synthase [Brasilonema sp. CT11]
MTVSSCNADSFVYNKELYRFLLAVQQNCIKNNDTQIASFALDIDWVDPLVVLDKLAQPNKVSFYWENRGKKEALAAVDAVAKIEVAGKDRFIKSEEFIKKCVQNITSFSRTNQAFFETRFLCSFSFFDQNTQPDYPFSAATIFLPRWQVAVKNQHCVLVMNAIIDNDTNIKRILQSLSRKLEIINSLQSNSQTLDYSLPKFSNQSIANPQNFKSSVLSALEKIESKDLTKVVLADILDVRSNGHLNVIKSLNNLRQLHPNCYVFSHSNGKGQNFIGASPERLISIQEQQLMTDALAGSAPRGKTPGEDAAHASRLLNSYKERHEHSLVIDFITQRLSKLGLLPQVLAPRLRQLSNIQHLWTPISALVPADVHPLKIVAQLHPTPAVGGTSQEVACREIRRFERFERGLYAAPLGWVDLEGNCEFIVGIRSALIDGDRARLYAGVGIVDGSDPDKELAEVQLKLQALLKALV